MSELTTWAQPIPLQPVPDDVSARVADLRFAGRYIPAGPGPEPIAGDFYDLVHLDDDRVAVVLADVAGHGVQALARMQQLRAAARAYALEDSAPASVLGRLDRFCGRLDAESIATMWYGEYRPSTGTLTYASAGHPPPVLTCPVGGTRLLALASAPPLGVGSADAPAVEEIQHISRGAILVAYSDGLVERRAQSLDDQLGLLQAAVTTSCAATRSGRAHDIAGEILDALLPNPHHAEDDVCLLVLRREP